MPAEEASFAGASLVALSLIVLAVLFTATETAIGAVRRARLQQLADEGSLSAIRLQRLLEASGAFVSTARLIGTVSVLAANTVLVVVFGPYGTEMLGSRTTAYGLILAVTLLLTLVMVQQMGPALGLRHAESLALSMALPGRFAVLALSPLIQLLDAVGSMIYRQPGAASRDTSTVTGVTEAGIILQVDVAEEEGVLEEDEGEMIRSIFEFGDTVSREIMVPRIDIQGCDATMTLGDVVDLAIEAGHSRVPIYEGTIDKVVGIFYVKDALRFLREGRRDVLIREIIRPAYFVPETKKVDDLLREMQARRVHVAIVVDEYGGTAGLVTIEDILEEIVGEIQDEFDAEETMLQQISEHEAVVDAIMPLDDVNDLLSISLEEEDVDTLGGFVYARLGRVPVQGDVVEDGSIRLIVEVIEGNRITKVRIVKPPTASDAALDARGAGDNGTLTAPDAASSARVNGGADRRSASK